MSMNIQVNAIADAWRIGKNGENIKFQLKKRFDCNQTPTLVTRQILNATDPTVAYIDWCMERSIGCDQTEDVFASGDIFQENQPIGVRTFNPWVDHVNEFKQWIEKMTDDGFTIKFFEM